MNSVTCHRGPDATNFIKSRFADSLQQTIYIGNNRLKIIDKSDLANQPFISPCGKYIISFNGEIYNYLELKKNLDVQLKTTSDTEVLLHLLIKYNIDALQMLNGMFGVIFYDGLKNEVTIARDRFGMKPVYYYEDENYFICSSEIQSILSTNLVKKKLNSKQIPHYLSFKFACKPETFYQNIYELEEGHYIKQAPLNPPKGGTLPSPFPLGSGVGKSSRVLGRGRCPVDIEPALREAGGLSSKEIINKTETLLINSVEKHLRADVPAGIFLSGGVDSTLLLAIINELGIKNFPSFTIGNTNDKDSFGTKDHYFAGIAAQQYKSDHHHINIDSSIMDYIDKLIVSLDQPIADGAALLTYILSEETKNFITTVLSGAGADEMFAGYNRHAAWYFYLRNRNKLSLINSGLKPALCKLSRCLPTGFDHPLREPFRLISKFIHQIDKDPGKTFVNFTSAEGFDTAPLTAPLNPPKGGTLPFPFPLGSGVGKSPLWGDLGGLLEINYYLNKGLQLDRSRYLISDVLALTDKMAMRHSLEVRMPYLDMELTGFINTIEPEKLFKHGRKWILKKILNNKNGRQYVKRRKEGFGMPFGSWLKEKKCRWVSDTMLKKKHLIYQYVDYNKTCEMINTHLKNKRDYSTELWSLFVLTKWLEKEFN